MNCAEAANGGRNHLAQPMNARRIAGSARASAQLHDVHQLLHAASVHYRAALRASVRAVAYLRARGIGGAIAGRYGLGFAAPGWNGLTPVLSQYDRATILASGLQASSVRAPERRYDRFRDRIMFPIRDVSGAIAGYGGRVLDDSNQPKYMNSPEGPCFQKRDLLYGLYEAREAIEAAGQAIIVEGYLDVLMLAQAGLTEAVGTLGTACTPGQIAQLATRVRRLVFAFDGDDAGRRAALAALTTVLPFATDALAIDFLFLPAKHDPDSYVRAHGGEAFRALLANAAPLSDLAAQYITEGRPTADAESRSRCISRAKPLWRALPQGRHRQDLMDFCCALSGLTSDEVAWSWEL